MAMNAIAVAQVARTLRDKYAILPAATRRKESN
jgi:hypothetical protein